VKQRTAWQLPPVLKMKTGAASRYLTARSYKGGQLSLIIPNASGHGPPTSSLVLVNLGMSIESAIHGLPLLTKLEARLLRLWAVMLRPGKVNVNELIEP